MWSAGEHPLDAPTQHAPAVVVDRARGEVLLIGGRDRDRRGPASTAVWRRAGAGWQRGDLPVGLAYPRAWSCDDDVGLVVVGSPDDGDDALLLCLDRQTLASGGSHRFAWPRASDLHVDRRGRRWALAEPPAPALLAGRALLPDVIPAAMPFASPLGALQVELPDGALLTCDPEARGSPPYAGAHLRAADGGAWTRIATVPCGMRGVTEASAVLPDGRVALLTVHGHLVRVDPRAPDPEPGSAEVVARLDEDEAGLFWAGAALALLDPAGTELVAVRSDEARRVDLRTGEVVALAPPTHRRMAGRAIAEPDGRVLLVGGYGRGSDALPPELWAPVRWRQRRPRRPVGLNVVFPEGPRRPLGLGSRVRLIAGRYAGLDGRVLELDPERGAAQVEVSLFGRSLQLTVELAALAVAEEQG